MQKIHPGSLNLQVYSDAFTAQKSSFDIIINSSYAKIDTFVSFSCQLNDFNNINTFKLITCTINSAPSFSLTPSIYQNFTEANNTYYFIFSTVTLGRSLDTVNTFTYLNSVNLTFDFNILPTGYSNFKGNFQILSGSLEVIQWFGGLLLGYLL